MKDNLIEFSHLQQRSPIVAMVSIIGQPISVQRTNDIQVQQPRVPIIVPIPAIDTIFSPVRNDDDIKKLFYYFKIHKK